MYIKLKMGKNDNETAEQPNTEDKETPKEDKKTEEDIEEQEEEKPEKTEKSLEEGNKKEDAEKLRKVIKLDDSKKEDKEGTSQKDEESDLDIDTSNREGLEQKRAVLQSIKDFDFQIKKNQEEITSVNKKLDSVSKDLDDLVSLYEIVSEQMNPFVGLSKVTKKRLDALENFTREIEILKERTAELESFAERSGAQIRDITISEKKAKTIDTDSILKGTEKVAEIKEKEDEKLATEIEIEPEEQKENVEEEKIGEIKEDVIKIEQSKPESDNTKKQVNEVDLTTEIEQTDDDYPIEEELSDDDINRIIELSFSNLSIDGTIDMILNDFIENLKG